MLIFKLVDFCGRRETPAGGRHRGDPAGALAPRRLPEPPAESEAPGAKINSQIKHSPLKIGPFWGPIQFNSQNLFQAEWIML
jgi:hypothetical protein